MKDIVRAMAIVNNIADLNAVIKCLIKMHENKEFEIVRKKDRHVEAPSIGGWRDLVTFLNSSCFLTFKSHGLSSVNTEFALRSQILLIYLNCRWSILLSMAIFVKSRSPINRCWRPGKGWLATRFSIECAMSWSCWI